MVKRCALLFVTGLALVPRAHAQRQASDWEVVKRIPIGTQISVQLGPFWFPVKCHLEDVTDEDLTCGQGWPIAMQAVTYSRRRIRTVRIAHNTALIGLVVGASAGTVIGLAQDPRPGLGRGGDAVITAGLLGLFAAGVGGILSPLFPGRVVYRATRNPNPPGPTDQSPTHSSIAPESTPAPRPVPPGSKEDFGAAPSKSRLFFASDTKFSEALL